MTLSRQVPDQGRALLELQRRVTRLEKRDRTAAEEELPRDVAVFSYSGLIVSGTTSPPWRTYRGGKLERVEALLGTAPTSTLTVNLDKNGTEVEDFTIASGETEAVLKLSSPVVFAPGFDLLTVRVTGGASAADLTVFAILY